MTVHTSGVTLIFTGGLISLAVPLNGPNGIWGLYKCNYCYIYTCGSHELLYIADSQTTRVGGSHVVIILCCLLFGNLPVCCNRIEQAPFQCVARHGPARYSLYVEGWIQIRITKVLTTGLLCCFLMRTKVYFLLWINVVAVCTLLIRASWPPSASSAQIGKRNILPLCLSQVIQYVNSD